MKQNKSRGMTLIELLVSVSAIAILSTLIVQVFFTTTRLNHKYMSSQDIKSSGDFALDVIERMVRNSHNFTSTCDPDQGPLTQTVTFVNPDLFTTTIKCMSDGNAARIASVSADELVSYLTGGSVTLSASGGTTCTDSTLTFSCDALSGTGPLSVTFSLRPLGTGNPTDANTSTFTTSIQSRNME